MGLDIKIEAQGISDTLAALKDVQKSVKNNVLRAAMTYAIKPYLPAARAAAPAAFGVLKKSLITRIKVYNRGESPIVVGLVGPATKFKAFVVTTNPITGQTSRHLQKPSKYAHLVESGTKEHNIPPPGFGKKALKKRGLIDRTKSKLGLGPKGWVHPATRAQPFLYTTAVSQSSGFIERFTQKFAKQFQKQYDSARAKGKRFYDFEGGA